jgi:hypothetical protein
MNDLHTCDPFSDKVHRSRLPHLPAIYPNNDVLTATAEPEIAYLLNEVKKIKEDIDLIKEGKIKT